MKDVSQFGVVGTWVIVFVWNEVLIFGQAGIGWGIASLLLTPIPPVTSLLIGLFMSEWLPFAVVGAVTVVGVLIMGARSDE